MLAYRKHILTYSDLVDALNDIALELLLQSTSKQQELSANRP